jgi:catechol 2,3-dioxygenase-like lactoylglutathione lyase family enzyme
MLADAIAQATLPSSSLQRSSAFYEGKLGLTRARDQPPPDVRPSSVLYQCREGTRFAVIESSGAPSGSHTQLAFFVDDLAAEVRDLKAKGVAFEEYDLPGIKTVDGVAESPSAKVGWFKDPDGNLLAVIQVLV